MTKRYSVVCGEDVSDQIEALAREYDLTEQAVLRQLIERGLEQVEN
ncbi:CopG family transcriptional regulator [Haloarchaeobius amylolyticus]|nr:CopG family transcriptional regulator [Haloarchaeobius amylolyticus]